MNWIRRRLVEERGLAMLTVMWITVAATGLMSVMVAITTGALKSSVSHNKFESSLQSAEAGVDDALAELQADNDFSAGPDAPWATPPSEEDERTWARDQLLALAAAGNTVNTGSGDYVLLKPGNRNAIYAMGWSPSYGDANATARMLKAEYLFAPYKPGSAILTDGNLAFSSSVTVDVTAGVVSGKANVHTNGDGSASGCSQTVNGTVTSSGNYSICPGVGEVGSGGDKPLESVPTINPRFLYDEFSGTTTDWYDLCPDGRARVPAATPCTGPLALNGNVSSGGTFRGWSFTPGSGTTAPVWDMSSTTWGRGAYYVYHGDAYIERQTVVDAASVITEGAPSGGPADRCNMLGGKITAKLVSILSAAVPGIVLVAHDDLEVTSNFEAGTGLFGAGNQIKIETSSNGITGTVVANDTCTAGGDINEVKNAVVNYDKNVEVPLLDIIRTTQWLELNPN
jgi:hypothetical protein